MVPGPSIDPGIPIDRGSPWNHGICLWDICGLYIMGNLWIIHGQFQELCLPKGMWTQGGQRFNIAIIAGFMHETLLDDGMV